MSSVRVLPDSIQQLLAQMTLEEKIGQMSQVNGNDGWILEETWQAVAADRVGSLLNVVDPEKVAELQRVATQESRLGIPLLIGRDVIHGFRTIFPIPLGQAASWNPELVEQCARLSALEAFEAGVNWTFAPMIDITRDPRWGRIAESLGEDPYLCSVLAAAMVTGFQDIGEGLAFAACAKHFAGYGAAEAGRDYNTTDISEHELRNVYLRPFHAAVNAGVSTLMSAFSDLNGVPATGNRWLMQDVLRDEWNFDGVVVSDWESVSQLAVHGFTAGDRESALAAAGAGIDMEMASTTYRDHLPSLVADGAIDEAALDRMVGRILQLKLDLGLFDRPAAPTVNVAQTELRSAAKAAAFESLVLLKNDGQLLPLAAEDVGTLAVIGPLADDAYEQLGTWVFDGDDTLSETPLTAIRELVGDACRIEVARGLETSRSRDRSGFAEAITAAESADAVLLFLGEESILSGEAHSRADINLPGAQEQLIGELATLGKPLVLVVLAGRPLALGSIIDQVDALLYGWHPGTMGGPAIADVLFGAANPCGKLPVTFPRMVGQVPIYYAHKNTGKPATPDSFTFIDDIEPRAPQTSLGNTSFHLDAGYTPLFPFGFGLSYTQFEYSNLRVVHPQRRLGETVEIQVDLTNVGERAGVEIAQLYVRDLVASVTRPVRELKGFEHVQLQPGECVTVGFALSAADLAFYGGDGQLLTEPGWFHCWVGGSAEATLQGEFEIVDG